MAIRRRRPLGAKTFVHPDSDFSRFLKKLGAEIAERQVRTLRDMSEDEIRALEQEYGARVIRPT